MEEIASKMLKLCKEKEQEQLKAKNVGIDVTDCPFFNNSKCVGPNRECEKYQNCIFRQLKRKEQECAELKAQNKEMKQEQADKINSAYKQANDEIYQYIKTCICELCTQQDDCNGCYLKDFLNFIDNAREQN